VIKKVSLLKINFFRKLISLI